MSSLRAESSRLSRRAARWLLPAALLAVTPKCVLCVAAYAGLGTALGWGGAELCGGSSGTPISLITSVAWLGTVGLLGILAVLRRCAHSD
jgi:hypothetical protein